MGVWGDNSDQDEGNALIEQQIAQTNAEIEEKRQSIVKERLDVIKSQGAPTWTPTPLVTTIAPAQGKKKDILNDLTGGSILDQIRGKK